VKRSWKILRHPGVLCAGSKLFEFLVSKINSGRNAVATNYLVELNDEQLDQVTGGAITQVNNGGHEPSGVAVGIPAKKPGWA
jgi:hypothetical protein